MTEKENALDLSDEVLANGSDSKQGHEKKLTKYGKARQDQKDLTEFIIHYDPTLTKEIAALQTCSTSLWFRNWYTVDKYRLIGGCSCKKHLLCAMCALRRSAKTAHAVEQKILSVMAEYFGLIPVLITLTVKNGESLKERYEHITSSKTKLLQARRHALNDSKRRKTVSVTRFIHGSFGSYEFKKGSGGHGWHPHSHEIALLDPSVKFQKIKDKKGNEIECPVEFRAALKKEWQEITGDSFMVDVRKIDLTELPSGENSLLKGIYEASKYALKLNEIEHEDQVHAYKILRGRRLTFTYGSLWGIKIPDDLNDTIEDELKLLPYIDLCYSFYTNSKGQGEYRLQEVTDTKDSFFNPRLFKNPHRHQITHERLAVATKYSTAVKEYVSKLKKV